MNYEFVDNVLIFLNELSSKYIANFGEERVDIKAVWEEKIDINI